MQRATVVKRFSKQAMKPLLAEESAPIDSEKGFASGDLSMDLGKNFTKMPKFARFANPPSNIQSSVLRMRSLTRSRLALRKPSWEARYSFTRRSLKAPKFERFGHPNGDITAAVHDMRQAAAVKRATKQRSWAADFTLTKRPWKQPFYDRFAAPPKDIHAAVLEMREASMAKLACQTRSWAASYSFTHRTSKQPKFERFDRRSLQVNVHIDVFSNDNPGFFSMAFDDEPDDIRVSVEEMRAACAAKRAAKLTSKRLNESKAWLQSLWFTSETVRAMKERAVWSWIQEAPSSAEKVEGVVIEDYLEEVAKSSCDNAPAVDCTTKMLTAPPRDLDEISEHLQCLLACIQLEIASTDEAELKQIELRSLHPVPSAFPTSYSPAAPDADYVTQCILRDPIEFSAQFLANLAPLSEKTVREDCVRCERVLRNFRMEAEVFESQQEEEAQEIDRQLQADEVEQLIEEEERRTSLEQEQEKRQVEQLIEEEMVHAAVSSGSQKPTMQCRKLKKGSIADRLTDSRYAAKTMSADDAVLDCVHPAKSSFMAGSPAAAIRQMRSSPSAFRMDQDDKPQGPIRESSITRAYNTLGVEMFRLDDGDHDTECAASQDRSSAGFDAGSALAMDLDFQRPPSSGGRKHSKTSLTKSASLGSLKVSKSPKFNGSSLQPLVVSKAMPGFSGAKGFGKNLGSVDGWSVGNSSFQPFADPFAARNHGVRVRGSSVGACH